MAYARQKAALAQASWTIDQVNGSDYAEGSSTRPVGSWEEIKRRWGQGKLNPSGVAVDVHIKTDLDEVIGTDSLELPDNPGGGSKSLRIRGEQGKTVLYTSPGGVASPTSLVAASQTPNAIQDAAGGFDWATAGPGGTTLVGHRLRITSGARAEAVSWVHKKNTAAEAFTSPWSVVDPTATNPSLSPANVNPVAADPFVVEKLPKVRGLALRVFRHSAGNTGANATAVLVDSLCFSGLNDKGRFVYLESNTRNQAYLSRCAFSDPTESGLSIIIQSEPQSYFVNCGASVALQVSGFPTIVAGAYKGVSGLAQLLRVIIFNRNAIMRGAVSGRCLASAVDGFAVFDSTTDAVSGANNISGTFLEMLGAALLWGNNNTGHGINCVGGTIARYGSSKPIVTSATGGNDVKIHGVTVAYAAVNPSSFDAVNGCGIVSA